jgi:hypothetical protein
LHAGNHDVLLCSLQTSAIVKPHFHKTHSPAQQATTMDQLYSDLQQQTKDVIQRNLLLFEEDLEGLYTRIVTRANKAMHIAACNGRYTATLLYLPEHCVINDHALNNPKDKANALICAWLERLDKKFSPFVIEPRGDARSHLTTIPKVTISWDKPPC